MMEGNAVIKGDGSVITSEVFGDCNRTFIEAEVVVEESAEN